LNTFNGANLRRGETSSYPPFASASSAVRAVYAVHAVQCFVTSCTAVLSLVCVHVVSCHDMLWMQNYTWIIKQHIASALVHKRKGKKPHVDSYCINALLFDRSLLA